jgi:hypothetical protein
MTDTLFKEVHYSLGNLISDIGRGRIELHDNKRPLVWSIARRCARVTNSQSLPGGMAQPWRSE